MTLLLDIRDYNSSAKTDTTHIQLVKLEVFLGQSLKLHTCQQQIHQMYFIDQTIISNYHLYIIQVYPLDYYQYLYLATKKYNCSKLYSQNTYFLTTIISYHSLIILHQQPLISDILFCNRLIFLSNIYQILPDQYKHKCIIHINYIIQCSRLEIFLNGRGLGDLDFFSKSDPYVKVYFERKAVGGQWNLIGRTETIDNDLNPNWKKTFVLDYVFESTQPIKFQVFDDDGGNDQLIGTVETTLGALAGAKCQTSMLTLMNAGKAMGKLIVRCQKLEQCNQFLIMKWRAQKLLNTDSIFDWWNKSDPYLKFLKIRSDNSYIQAAQTEVVDNSLNPSWKTIQIPLVKLTPNRQAKFKIQCWDEQPPGKPHQFIGQIFMNVNNLKVGSYPLVNVKHKKPGTLVLESFNIVSRPSFIDYLRSGLQLNLIVAIDFTGSNGSPNSPSSLHYRNPHSLNQYQTAIRAVGQILLNYDSDKLIPAFGFGAKPRYPNFNQTVAHHCFPLSGDFQNIDAESMTHLEQLYSKAVMNVQFAGPTLFFPLMSQAFKLAQISRDQGSECYQILLILTDGEIHDMDQTVDLICANVHLPLSIIIVGIGNADFTNMNRLDGDDGLYNSKGQRAARDIVQFVPFREMNNNSRRLASELLAELPAQVVQYMTLVGKKPGQAKNLDFNQLLSSQMKRNDIQAVDNMFKQAGFFQKFMPGGNNQMQNSHIPGSQNPVQPMMASLYNSKFDYPEKK